MLLCWTKTCWLFSHRCKCKCTLFI